MMTGTAAFSRLLLTLGLIGVTGGSDTNPVLELLAPPGATVSLEGRAITCGPKEVCAVAIPTLPYSDRIIVNTEEGYEFSGLTNETHSSCDPNSSSCDILLTAKNFGFRKRDNSSTAIFQPIASGNEATTLSPWRYPARDRWLGAELEKNVDDCSVSTLRWDAPTTHFDINLDGIDDFLLHISCYQEVQPENNDEPHNIQVIAAWKMFCSEASSETHSDCTKSLFGGNVISATGTKSGGGNPYTHVMNRPRDLNGDGYPEFWYALNRDDGRPGLPNSSAEEFDGWIKKFCGETAKQDCTRTSTQSMLISNPDGTYQVAFSPTDPTNTQAAEVFPNQLGTFDLAMFNYGPMTAARWTGTEFIDVTSEWQGYANLQYAFQDQYVHAFEDDVSATTYLVVPNVPEEIVERPRPLKSIARNANLHLGFAIWAFIPGHGFELSDYYVASDEDYFSAKVATDEEGGEYEVQEGLYINGIPTLLPNFYHMKVARLSIDGDLVLFMQQEHDGGTPFGRMLYQPIDENTIYKFNRFGISDEEGFLTPKISPVQTFFIRSGKLYQTPEPLIRDGYLWSTPGLRFADADGDGHLDLFGISGDDPRGSIHINDGTGVFVQKKINAVTPITWLHEPSVDPFAKFSIFPLNLSSDHNLDLAFWESGFNQALDPLGAGDLVILEGNWQISEFSNFLANEVNEAAVECHKTKSWVGECMIH